MATTDQPQEPIPGQQPQGETAPTTPLPPASTAPGYPANPAAPQQAYPAYPTGAQPGYPRYPAGGTAAAPPQAPPPAPPASGSRSHVGVIIASIVGGLILLGLAFGSGAVVGYVVGTYHFGRMVVQEYGPGFQGRQLPPGFQGGPMHRHPGQQKQQQQQEEQEPTPSPSPTPSS